MDLKVLLKQVEPKGDYYRTISESLRKDFERIAPGSMHMLTTHDGQEFAVMRLEDLEVILERAGMRLAVSAGDSHGS